MLEATMVVNRDLGRNIDGRIPRSSAYGQLGIDHFNDIMKQASRRKP